MKLVTTVVCSIAMFSSDGCATTQTKIYGDEAFTEYSYSISVSLLLRRQVGRPVPVSQVLPEYPREMRDQGLVGAARILVRIKEDGSVGGVTVLKTNEQAFADSATSAAKTWKFAVMRRDGKSIKSEVEYEVVFETRENQRPNQTPEPTAPSGRGSS